MEDNNKQNSENMDMLINSLLSEHKDKDYIEITLPSKGIGYTFTDGGPKLKIKPMTFLDEKAILSGKKGGKDAVTILLERCVLNMNTSKMYIFDKLYVLLKIREVSYGDVYSVTATCPDCDKENNIDVNIDSLAINYVEDTFKDPFEFELPKLKKKVRVRIPKVEDENLLGGFSKSTSNLWRFVLSIDTYDSPVFISKLIDKLPLKDANAIVKAIINPKYGVIPSIKLECQHCQNINVIDLPITSDFFIGS